MMRLYPQPPMDPVSTSSDHRNRISAPLSSFAVVALVIVVFIGTIFVAYQISHAEDALCGEPSGPDLCIPLGEPGTIAPEVYSASGAGVAL